jgi:uncharacterized protein (DUF2141 family)
MFTYDRSRRATLAGLVTLAGALLDASRAAASDEVSTLTVQVTGARNDRGQVALLVFRDPAGYPDDPRRALRSHVAPLKDRSTTVLVRDLPPGRYVVTLIHDENRNGKLDTNILGIPTEGYGFSNNPKVGLSAPAFGACTFVVPSGAAARIDIGLRY